MKPIILTQEAKDNALEIFKNLLNNMEANADLKINITTETLLLDQGIEKPTVFVTAGAYHKMMALIKGSNKELAWYGTAVRINKNYLIEDILVYPQSVTSATVDADEEACAKWFMELPDETINKLKFQGHSHVGMGATPSGRDTTNWLQFANILKPNEFMILCIGNNKEAFYWNIYDKALNVFFENKDITMVVVDEQGNSISDWAKESVDKYIKEEKPVVRGTTPTRTYPSESYYQTYVDTPPTTSAYAKQTKTDSAAYNRMVAFIPEDLANDVDYMPESDVYFTYVIGVPGFYYSTLYEAYICHGATFRQAHPLVKVKDNKSKKEKKNK